MKLVTKKSIKTLQKILIIKKKHDSLNTERLKHIGKYLASRYNVDIYVEKSVYEKHELLDFKPFDTKLSEEIDYCISIGGDGTLLHLNTLFQNNRVVPPVVAFSAGSLGFLLHFHVSDMEKIMNDILEDREQYYISLRSRLECSVIQKGNNIKSITVLNEVTVERGEWLLPVPMEIYIGDKLLTVTRADGIIVSTPTGSTAYNMSAGGSMVAPSVSVIMITPICPHTLSFRPILIPDDSIVRIRVPSENKQKICVTFDGQSRQKISVDDEILIKRSKIPFPIIKKEPCDDFWFKSLREKLNWNNYK